MLRIPKIPVMEFPELFLNDDYTVSINGEPCEVRVCRVSALPFNRVFPGKQRSKEQTELASYITFSADVEVTLTVNCKRTFNQALIRPLSKNIALRQDGSSLTFTLKEKGGYTLELDGEHFALHIFFNEIKDYPEKENATYYFGPGVHCPGLITLKDNDSVYIDEEAIVYGSLNTSGADNIHIFGGGVLNGSYEERIFEHCYENYTKGNIRLYNSHNILIEDVILQDSATWVLALFDCDRASIDNIKIIGQWRYNTDGIDICNTSNVTITNSFIRAFDDVITIKGIYDRGCTIENIVTDNCVLWCGWGRTCEIGIETAAKEYRNITFRNCDLIHNSASALDIQNGNYADVHDITFENINVEYQTGTQEEVFQHGDDHIYDPQNPIGVPDLIFADNHKYAFKGDQEANRHFGTTHDIFYKNIHVTLEEGVPAPRIYFASCDSKSIAENFTIDGLYLNGEKVTSLDQFNTTIDNVENVLLL